MKKYKYLISVFIILMLTAALGVALYFILSKTQSTLDEIEKQELEKQIQEEQIKNLPNLEATHNKITSEEGRLTLVYTEEQVVEVIRNIEAIAKTESITLAIAQQKVEEKTKTLKKEASDDKKNESKEGEKESEVLTEKLPFEKSVRLEIRAKGKYQSIRNFIHKIETAPYALDVLSVDGSVAPEEESGKQVNVVKSTTSQSSDSPFLLSASGETQEAVAPPAAEQVQFVINVALYTK
jgi:hypothetical protein